MRAHDIEEQRSRSTGKPLSCLRGYMCKQANLEVMLPSDAEGSIGCLLCAKSMVLGWLWTTPTSISRTKRSAEVLQALSSLSGMCLRLQPRRWARLVKVEPAKRTEEKTLRVSMGQAQRREEQNREYQ